jgi:hypothetical protein
LKGQKVKYFVIITVCFSLCSLIYSQDNNPALFEPDKIIEDIDFLLASLNNIHPTFNLYFYDNSFRTKIDSIKKAIHQPISQYEFFKIMQPLISVDSHTSLRFDGKIYPEVAAPFFPFKILIMNNQIYIKENLSSNEDIKKGMIIESINGLQSSEIIKHLSKYIPYDGSQIRLYKIASDFQIFYRLVYGNFSEFSLVIKNNGKKNQISVPGIKLENFGPESKPKFDFKMLENSIAYFYIGKFRKPDYFMTYLDSIFSILHNDKIEYLIIDKRSGGGFTSLADSLLSYITDKPYKTFEKKAVKISSANQDYVNDNNTMELLKMVI